VLDYTTMVFSGSSADSDADSHSDLAVESVSSLSSDSTSEEEEAEEEEITFSPTETTSIALSSVPSSELCCGKVTFSPSLAFMLPMKGWIHACVCKNNSHRTRGKKHRRKTANTKEEERTEEVETSPQSWRFAPQSVSEAWLVMGGVLCGWCVSHPSQWGLCAKLTSGTGGAKR
jgi:hypothetical protein